MTNQEIANLAAGEKQNNAKRDAALLACRHKDEEMKRHEQSLSKNSKTTSLIILISY